MLIAHVTLSLWAGLGAAPDAPLNPRTPTGYSTIEQRWVYAQPDEGVIEFPLMTGLAGPNEVLLEEPSMCAGEAKVRYTYSKRRGKVVLEAFFKGLPYRMSFTRPVDVSTRFNQFPVSVQNGKWQFWIVATNYSHYINFYYDGASLELLGSQFDFPNGMPAGAFPVSLPVGHMIASPLFEGKPNGNAYVRFEYDYNALRDEQGKAGVYYTFAPYSLCRPDEYGVYYTQGGLPDSELVGWDDILHNIHSGYVMGTAISLEPDPKPAYLASRDNTMIGWGGMYPSSLIPEYGMNFAAGAVQRNTVCQTRILPPFPRAFYEFCGQ